MGNEILKYTFLFKLYSVGQIKTNISNREIDKNDKHMVIRFS